jgi:NADPH:quinone reductase-like Zn-dependent oxidoreductase
MSVPGQPVARYQGGMNTDPTASERIVVTRRDHLELLPWRVPAPTTGQLRVRVAYSAVSFGDVMLRRHVFRKRPAVAVPGYEVVGTVDAAGPDAAGLQVGDRVAAFVEYGGNARHALVRAADAVALPEGIDDAHAAAVVLNYATALGLIDAAGLAAGDAFLITGASGGVGTAVLDTGGALGLRGFGTTRAGGRPVRELFGARLFDAGSPTLVADVRAASDGGVATVFDSRAGRGHRARFLSRQLPDPAVLGAEAAGPTTTETESPDPAAHHHRNEAAGPGGPPPKRSQFT